MRKLVSIQTIAEVQPIQGADAIELARVLGWLVVIKKGEFQVGDKVVYAEVDSVFPKKPEFEFLEARKYRIRTIKLRGQISQGICFPLSILPKGTYQVDQEVTELLGVIKYEKAIPYELEGVVKGTFPSFIKQTDETRVQVLQEILTANKGKTCVVTEKIDGTSTTFFWNEGEFGVCSRNWTLEETEENLYWRMAKKYTIQNKLDQLFINIAIQGETIGSKVQGNKYKLPDGEHKFYVFNIFNIDEHRYLDYEEFMAVVEVLGLETVPFLDIAFTLTDNIDELIDLSKGQSVLNPTMKREGFVIKERIQKASDLRMNSFKVINPEFLLKFNDE